MSQKDAKFKWTKKKLEVAKLLDEGTKTHEEIAKECDIARETLSRWEKHPDFLAKVDEFILMYELATNFGWSSFFSFLVGSQSIAE